MELYCYSTLLYCSSVHLECVIRCTEYVQVYTWYVSVHTIVVFSTHLSVPSAHTTCFSVRRRSCYTWQLPSRTLQSSWAFGKSKLMSRPVTSWLERMERRNPRRTSDTSKKVPHVTSDILILYQHITNNISVSTIVAWWYYVLTCM